MAENSSGKPYTELKITRDTTRRVFARDINSSELVWHRDREDRQLTIIAGVGWGLQFDNKLPEPISPGDVVYIPKMMYHRLLLGDDDLVIDIKFI